jgi:hypothetical protein
VGGARRLLIDSGTTTRGQYRALPSTPFTIDVVFDARGAVKNSPFWVGFEESGTNEQLVISAHNGLHIVTERNSWAFGATRYQSGTDARYTLYPAAFRVEHDGTNLKFYVRHLHGDYHLVYSTTSGTFLTPDRLVVGFEPGTPAIAGSVTQSAAWILDWTEA